MVTVDKAALIQALSKEIEELAAARAVELAARRESDRQVSVAEIIAALRTPVRKALKAGCTRDALAQKIATGLSERGMTASPSTVKTYLTRSKRRGSPRRRLADSAVTAPAVAAEPDENAGAAKSDEAPNAIDGAQATAGEDRAAKLMKIKEMARRAGVLRE